MMEWISSCMCITLIIFGLMHDGNCQMVDLPGNVTVVGLFGIHSPKDGTCGQVDVTSVMAVEAVKWYFRNLNSQADAKLQIGFRGYRTCRLSGLANELAAGVLHEVVTAGRDDRKIVGVIGPEYSEEAEGISTILSSATSDFRLPQVAYSATSALLGNNRTYPNFFRVIPNDNIQIQVMISMMKEIEWNRIGIIFENDLYGKSAAEEFKTRAAVAGICIAGMRPVTIGLSRDVSSNEIHGILDAFVKIANPAINGIVVFATEITVNILLAAIDQLAITDYPVFIISEAIELQESVFYSQQQIINKAKGSYVLSPPKSEITEFQSYWRGIFKDSATLQTEMSTNPWLLDVYRNIKKCDAASECPLVSLTDEELDQAISTQPIYVHYAILAAHSMAKAVSIVHNNNCGDTTWPCDNFQEQFRPADMIEVIKNMNMNPANDFSFSLSSLSARYSQLSFSAGSEIQLPDDTTSYEVYNYRSTDGNGDDFQLMKIGELEGDAFSLDKDRIRDYDSTGTLTWPNIRKGTCIQGKVCQECIPDDLADRHLHFPGDFYVVGIVPIHDRNTFTRCGDVRATNGYDIVKGIEFALQRFNSEATVYTNMFPGKTIGAIILNSCNNPVVVQAKILELHKRGLRLDSGEYINVSEKILGYIGALGSSVSIGMAQILSNLKQVQISYSSTNPGLSDKEQYPYFLRVVTPDDKQADAMLQIVEELDGNYVQILYSEGAYGEGGLAALRDAAERHKICLVQAIMVKEGASYYEYYNELRSKPEAKLVIVFLRSHIVPEVLKVISGQMKERGEFQFIGSEAWAKNAQILETDTRLNTLGSFTLVVEMSALDGLATFVKTMTPEPFNADPWVSRYLEKILGCYFNGSFEKIPVTKPMCSSRDVLTTRADIPLGSWTITSANAVLSLLMGAWKLFETKCDRTAVNLCDDFQNDKGLTLGGLVQSIIDNAKLDIFGDGNTAKVFNENGDGSVGYTIYNVQRTADNPQKLEYKRVGTYPLQGDFVFQKNLIVYPTGEKTESVCPTEQICAECIAVENEAVVSNEDTSLNVTGMIVLGILCAILAIAIVVLTVVVIRSRKPKDPIYLTPEHQEQSAGKRPDAIGHSPSGSIEHELTTM